MSVKHFANNTVHKSKGHTYKVSLTKLFLVVVVVVVVGGGGGLGVLLISSLKSCTTDYGGIFRICIRL